MVLLVCSNAELLEDLRQEVGSILEINDDDKENVVRSLDITDVKSHCPLLASTFQEVLRYRTMGTSVREVMEDTVLDGQWLLKKGCMIQMPSRVIHTDASLWGADVDQFVPGRFMRDETKKSHSASKRPNPQAFRAFGGGTTLCPGRHFATNEIMAVLIMFIMRFDVNPVSGQWSLPKTENTNVAAVVMEPDTDIEVKISFRKGFENGRWAFRLRDSELVFAVVEEDRRDHDA
jgi:cytochrome P450